MLDKINNTEDLLAPKIINLEALADEIWEWSSSLLPGDIGACLEIKFENAEGRSFKKILLAKDKLASLVKAKEFLKVNLDLATKHFGEIKKIVLNSNSLVMRTPKFGGFSSRPATVKTENVGPSKRAGVYEHRPNRTNSSYYFGQLEVRPENLKEAVLERLKTRRAIFMASNLLEMRDNQVQSLDKIEQFLADGKAGLHGFVVQPTGAGKTVLFGLMIKLIDLPTIILVPDSNLLEQIKEELVKTLKIDIDDIGLLDSTHRELGRKLMIGTYAIHNSLIRSGNSNYKKQMALTAMVICDEAHEAVGKKTTLRLNQQQELAGALKIGFTATPQLLQKHIGEHFGNEIDSSKFSEQVALGVLVKLHLIEIKANIFKNELAGGQLNEKDENNIVTREQLFERTLAEYMALRERVLADGKPLRTAVYLNRIEHAYIYQKMAAELGLKTEVVVSDTHDNSKELRARIKRIEADLMAGKLDMVVAVNRMAQGWDFKPLNCVVLAAPMISPKKIIQRVGRGARKFEGKDCCYVIAPNFKIKSLRKKSEGFLSRLKKSNLIVKDEEKKEREEREVDDDKTYVLGEQLSVRDSLREFGESDQDLDQVCQVVRENVGEASGEESEDEVEEHLPWISNKVPLEYFAGYFNNLERMRNDLQKFAEKNLVEDIEFLRLCHFKDERIDLANGVNIKGKDYLSVAGYMMLDSGARMYKALANLKEQLGIFIPPLSDAAYYTRRRVRADYTLMKRKAGRFTDDYSKFLFAEFYNSDEKPVNGARYLTKAMDVLIGPSGDAKTKLRYFYVWFHAWLMGVGPDSAPAKEKIEMGEDGAVDTNPTKKKQLARVDQDVLRDLVDGRDGSVFEDGVQAVEVAEVLNTDDVVDLTPVASPDVEIVKESRSKLEIVLADLDVLHRSVAEAVLIQGKSVKQAAEDLGVSLGKVMMISAKVKLLMKDDGQE